MSMRRDRVVYFRISNAEFDQMVTACDSKGVANISELVRVAVHQYLKSQDTQAERHVVNAIEALRSVVDDLSGNVQRLPTFSSPAPAQAGHDEQSGSAIVSAVFDSQKTENSTNRP
jgi:hypothetical protein